MTPRTRVVGVDFSGARDAGNKIWIAESEVAEAGLRILSCRRARELPNGAVERDGALRALADYLAGQGDIVAGLDFPFSLPPELIREPSWERFVRGFTTRYPTPERFRADCARRADGRELKRRTDVEAQVPFSAYNLRLYRQTYWGIGAVLHPLIANGSARVVPVQAPRDGAPLIAETCPASILKRVGLYGSYKGKDKTLRDARAAILGGLVERGLLRRPKASTVSTLVDDAGGDAVDAVVAAIGAARVAADPGSAQPRDDLDRIEARVYF